MDESKQNESLGSDPPPLPDAAGHSSDPREEMGWVEHLDELRVHIFRSTYAWLICSVGAYFFSTEILNFLKKPLMNALPDEQKHLFYTSLFENFLVPIKVSAYSGLFLAGPFILYQLWLFVSPGLYRREKKIIVPFIMAGSFFFIGGAAFGYFVVFPAAFDFLINYNSGAGNIPIITLQEYFGTSMKMLLIFGLCFELPVIMVLLGLLGILPSSFLKKNRGVAFLILSILCAFFSPPDLLSMFFLLIPLYLFFEGAILTISIFEKAKGQKH